MNPDVFMLTKVLLQGLINVIDSAEDEDKGSPLSLMIICYLYYYPNDVDDNPIHYRQ